MSTDVIIFELSTAQPHYLTHPPGFCLEIWQAKEHAGVAVSERAVKSTRIRRSITVAAAAALAPAGLLVAAGAGSAAAAPPDVLRAAQARDLTCTARPYPRTNSVDSRTFTSTVTGILQARLTGGGDWDVGVFDARTRRYVAGSAGSRTHERAESLVRAGRRLLVQACRYAGTARRARQTVSSSRGSRTPPRGRCGSPACARPPRRRARVCAARLDVEDSPGGTARRRAARRRRRAAPRGGRASRARCSVPDVAAADAADGRAERAYAAQTRRSGLPSGRTPTAASPTTSSSSSGSRAATRAWCSRCAWRTRRATAATSRASRSPATRGASTTASPCSCSPASTTPASGRPARSRSSRPTTSCAPTGAAPARAGSSPPPARSSSRSSTRTASTSRARRAARPWACPCARRPTSPCAARTAAARAPGRGRFARRADDRRRGPQPQLRRVLGRRGGELTSLDDAYRGPGPFSEPETRNLRALLSTRQVTNLLSMHTLRRARAAPARPRERRLRARRAALRGARRAPRRRGRRHQPVTASSSTTPRAPPRTGATGRRAGSPTRSSSASPASTPSFERGVVDAYLGRRRARAAARAPRSGRCSTRRPPQPATRRSPAGRRPARRLTVRRSFQTVTSPVWRNAGGTDIGAPIAFADHLRSSLLARGGAFSWALNPSTRPFVAGRSRAPAAAPPQPPAPLANPPGIPAEDRTGALDRRERAVHHRRAPGGRQRVGHGAHPLAEPRGGLGPRGGRRAEPRDRRLAGDEQRHRGGAPLRTAARALHRRRSSTTTAAPRPPTGPARWSTSPARCRQRPTGRPRPGR